jgi:hypothetical protein
LKLGLIQRLDQFAGKMAPCCDFEGPFVDPRPGCIIATLLCQEPRAFLAIRALYHLDVLKFPLSENCLA